jgi:lincosamide nucleotidyltransferase A/C/D/E
MDAASLIRIVDGLETAGLNVWLDGGWGVDALLGYQDREHDDLDLVAKVRDSDRIIELLQGLGYQLAAGAPPRSFVVVDRLGLQVDVHPVTFTDDGGGVFQMDDVRSWVYPAEGFSGRGSVAGRPVRCLSPEVQVLVHAGYELTRKDYRELFLLRQQFGVALPDEVSDAVSAPGTGNGGS